MNYPYVLATGNISSLIEQLRSKLPKTLDASIIKQYGITYQYQLIQLLTFIGIIDSTGTPTEEARKIFSQSNNEDFQTHFTSLIKESYKELFELYSEPWAIDKEKLITFFRENDQCSEDLGKRKASTFIELCQIAGQSKASSSTKQTKPTPKKTTRSNTKDTQPPSFREGTTNQPQNNNIGLTVRIEINLPSDGTKETYDNIFKSIKENLING